MVIKHITIDPEIMRSTINKEIAELKDEFTKEHDNTLKEKIRLDYESMESFVSMLAATQSKIFDFQLHIMITADSQDELNAKKLQVNNYLVGLNMRAIPMMFEQEKVLKSMLAIFPKPDIEDRVGIPMPSPTMAAMYPFVFDSVKDPGKSTLFGVDRSGGVVLFNQFLYQQRKEMNRNNANMIILGTSGSGKSTAAKLLLRGAIRNGYQSVCIDPDDELRDMVLNFGGDVIDLGKGGDFGMINPLEVIIDADEEEISQGLGYTVLTKTLQFLKAFMKYYDPSIEEDVLNLFSEVVQDTYKRFGIDFNSDFSNFKSKDFPTFTDVYATIRGKMMQYMDKTHESDIMERL